MENRIRELENEVDEMQDSFEVSALKDKNSMYHGDIKRLESENAALRQRLAQMVSAAKNVVAYFEDIQSYETPYCIDRLELAIAAEKEVK